MMVNLGAAVNVIHGIRTHHAQATGCPTWDEAGIRKALSERNRRYRAKKKAKLELERAEAEMRADR